MLVVDDEAANLSLITRLLSADGHRVLTARDGEAGLLLIGQDPPDVILLDVGLPGMDGFEVCRQVKGRKATRLTPVVLVTGLSGPKNRRRGIEAGADDFLTKPFDAGELEARVRSLMKLKRYTDELESADSVIMSLALTIDARDRYTRGHCAHVAGYAVAVGDALGLDGASLAILRKGSYLHDIGKVGVPDAILQKPGRLTDAEFAIIRTHPIIGEQLCGSLRSLAGVRPIIRWHHERLDGTGYPDALRGDAIPLLARIVSVVDAFDAMTTDRPYRAALDAEQACVELARDGERGALYGPAVAAMLRLARSVPLSAVWTTEATQPIVPSDRPSPC